jgi:hypothetical protein
MYGTLIASLSVVVLMLAANETWPASGAAPRGGFNSRHSMFRPSAAHSLRHHHRRNDNEVFWPGFDDSYYGSPNGEPLVDGAQPGSGNTHYTSTYDVPWDWAHRFPPAVAPSAKPYVSTCPAETVTVPGRTNGEQTINIMRCY